MKKCEKTS